MIKTLSMVLEGGRNLHYDFNFTEQGTLKMPAPCASREGMGWLDLDFCRCSDCSLDKGQFPHCPVAEVLAEYAHDLADRQASEKVKIHAVQDDNREIILRDIPLHSVVSELVRLALFQSHCPIGRKIKPAMCRLQPFPRGQECLQAVVSFFAEQETLAPGYFRDGQLRYLQSLHDVLGSLCRRLEHAGHGDVYLKGVEVLHALSLLLHPPSTMAPKS